MKIHPTTRRRPNPGASPHHPYFEGDTSGVPAPVVQPAAHRRANLLILENKAEIASNICLKSGHPVSTKLTINLRDPLNPGSWYGETEKAVIGLDPSNTTRFRVTTAMAWGLITMGALLFVAGMIWGWLVGVLGLLALGGGSALRASAPVSGVMRDDGTIEIRGCGEPFLDLFPEENRHGSPTSRQAKGRATG